ncbi:hypothetical protein [uncultured Amnibacterium sp.]|uniref:hypothetical protein n=1 Tax=uncultured Amnibacterium sp. TaxID=1631851 RepID=UPI0035CA8D27
MADQGDDWTSPGGAARPDPEPPRYGERIPGWSQPAAAPVPVPAPTTYTPPPKPGLIPLHPLSFGQILGSAFAVIRFNPRATIPPALIISLIQNVLTVGLTYLIGFTTVDRIERAANDADRATIATGAALTGGAGFLAVLVASVVGSALLQGLLTRVVADGALGRRPTAGEALRAAAQRFWPLVGFSVLLGAAQLVLLLVFSASAVGLFVAFSGLANDLGIVVAILVALPIGAALTVLYLWFAVKLSLSPSVIVLERLPVRAAIARSWRLTHRAFWRTLGVLVVVTAMVSVASQIVSTPFSFLGGAISGLLFPNSSGDLGSNLPQLFISTLPALIVAVIVTGIGQIAQVSAIVLVYLDRRMRTEGLDLELQRFVEQGGDDPFERVG